MADLVVLFDGKYMFSFEIDSSLKFWLIREAEQGVDIQREQSVAMYST